MSAFPGFYLSKLVNLVINDDTAFPFGQADALNTAYATWTIGDPTKVIIVQEGWWWLGGDFTTLGTSYAGANNSDWLAFVGRNGIDLAHSILGERHRASSALNADLMTLGPAPRFLTAGDELQVFFQNANGTNILVESNPSTPPGSGSDYTAQPGTGAMSPHFFGVFIGDAP